MKVFAVIALLFAFLVNIAQASPLGTRVPHDPPTILKDFERVSVRVAELDKNIKAFSNKTNVGSIRNLTFNVELALIQTTNNVLWNKEFNDKDSKAITQAAVKMKSTLEGLLRDVVAKKEEFKKSKQLEFMRNNFESLHKRTFPLADALEDRTTDRDSKEINTSIDQVDKAFEGAFKQLA